MEVAARFICESLKEFSRQSKPKLARHVLQLFGIGDFRRHFVQAAPNEVGPAAEIDNAAGQTFIHRHIGLALEYFLRIERKSIAPDPFFVAHRLLKGLAEHDSAVFNRVMSIYFQIASAPKHQINYGMPRKKRQHMIEKGNACFD